MNSNNKVTLGLIGFTLGLTGLMIIFTIIGHVLSELINSSGSIWAGVIILVISVFIIVYFVFRGIYNYQKTKKMIHDHQEAEVARLKICLETDDVIIAKFKPLLELEAEVARIRCEIEEQIRGFESLHLYEDGVPLDENVDHDQVAEFLFDIREVLKNEDSHIPKAFENVLHELLEDEPLVHDVSMYGFTQQQESIVRRVVDLMSDIHYLVNKENKNQSPTKRFKHESIPDGTREMYEQIGNGSNGNQNIPKHFAGWIISQSEHVVSELQFRDGGGCATVACARCGKQRCSCEGNKCTRCGSHLILLWKSELIKKRKGKQQ